MSSLPASINTDLLSAYIDGYVTADERARVEQALNADDELRANLTDLQYTVNLFKDAPKLAVPRSFVLSEQDVLAAGGQVRGVAQPGFWQRLLGSLTQAMPLATAAVAALLLLSVVLPRFADQQPGQPAAREEAAALIAAAPAAEAEAQLMIAEEPAADVAASAMAAPAESAAEMVEEPRLFSQGDAAEKLVEESPAATLKVAPETENAAEMADAQAQPEAAAPMAMAATAEAPPAQNASTFSPLQIGLLILFVVMLAATIWLRRRARGDAR